MLPNHFNVVPAAVLVPRMLAAKVLLVDSAIDAYYITAACIMPTPPQCITLSLDIAASTVKQSCMHTQLMKGKLGTAF